MFCCSVESYSVKQEDFVYQAQTLLEPQDVRRITSEKEGLWKEISRRNSGEPGGSPSPHLLVAINTTGTRFSSDRYTRQRVHVPSCKPNGLSFAEPVVTTRTPYVWIPARIFEFDEATSTSIQGATTTKKACTVLRTGEDSGVNIRQRRWPSNINKVACRSLRSACLKTTPPIQQICQ